MRLIQRRPPVKDCRIQIFSRVEFSKSQKKLRSKPKFTSISSAERQTKNIKLLFLMFFYHEKGQT
jgi:hypothetical protein